MPSKKEEPKIVIELPGDDIMTKCEGVFTWILTPALTEELVQLVAGGLSESSAAACVGLPEKIWQDWTERAYAQESPYYELQLKLRMAVARFEKRLIDEMLRCPPWNPKGWLLERRFPEKWKSRWAEDGMSQQSPSIGFKIVGEDESE